LGDPAGSNATTGLALRVTGTHKPLYHIKVEIPIKGTQGYCHYNKLTPKEDINTLYGQNEVFNVKACVVCIITTAPPTEKT
jgi:hypothetical protein